ncbi:MAG: hypothetical protein ACI9EF_003170 [Pseudohongiellaceae bacterium]|jgi:hypothetical protein
MGDALEHTVRLSVSRELLNSAQDSSVQGVTLAGVLFDTRGKPALGRLVSLSPLPREGKETSTLSDVTGAFLFVGLGPGAYQLSADPGARLTLEIDDDSRVIPAELTMQLRALPQVEGQVIGPSGDPTTATVYARHESDSGLWDAGQTPTNPSGRFSFEGLRLGRYLLWACDGNQTTSLASEVTLGVHESVPQELRYSSGGLRGQVVHGTSGAPLGSVNLRASRMDVRAFEEIPDWWMPTLSSSDSHGNYAFEGLSPGRYSISPDSATYIRQEAFLDMVVVKDELVTYQVQLIDGASLFVTVAAPVEFSFADLWFSIEPEAEGYSSVKREYVEDETGGLHMTTLVPGHYRYVLQRSAETTSPRGDAGTFYATGEVELVSGVQQQLRLQLTVPAK